MVRQLAYGIAVLAPCDAEIREVILKKNVTKRGCSHLHALHYQEIHLRINERNGF